MENRTCSRLMCSVAAIGPSARAATRPGTTSGLAPINPEPLADIGQTPPEAFVKGVTTSQLCQLGDLTAAFNRDSTALRQPSARPPRDMHAASQHLRSILHGSSRAINRAYRLADVGESFLRVPSSLLAASPAAQTPVRFVGRLSALVSPMPRVPVEDPVGRSSCAPKPSLGSWRHFLAP